MLVYLHGFRSSPQSFKARMLAHWMAKANLSREFACPQLPVSPAEAIRHVREQIALTPEVTLVGSSLGGYYATYLAEMSGCRAVLLNPAIHPARDLAPYVGQLRTYHDDQPMELRPEYLDELARLDTPLATFQQRYLLIAAKGDEVLDWREMVGRYRSARTILLEGGDHGLSDFDQHLADVFSFAGYGRVAKMIEPTPGI